MSVLRTCCQQYIVECVNRRHPLTAKAGTTLLLLLLLLSLLFNLWLVRNLFPHPLCGDTVEPFTRTLALSLSLSLHLPTVLQTSWALMLLLCFSSQWVFHLFQLTALIFENFFIHKIMTLLLHLHPALKQDVLLCAVDGFLNDSQSVYSIQLNFVRPFSSSGR